MNWSKEWKILIGIAAVFLFLYFVPMDSVGFERAVMEGLLLAQWYAREHVILCLIPAFFIAGAIAVFISKGSVMKYLGAQANKFLSYGVASISGSILAVCSCTVLPLFAGIYRMGAGLGPATAFLYSGPAINVLAIVLTARILGPELGVARAVGAVLFSIVIGLCMHLFFRREEAEKAGVATVLPDDPAERPLWQNAVLFAVLIAILVFATWNPAGEGAGFWNGIYSVKWLLTSLSSAVLGIILIAWFRLKWWQVFAAVIPPAVLAIAFPHWPLLSFAGGAISLSVLLGIGNRESKEWFDSTWGFLKQILPLLLAGVVVAGALLGRPGQEALIPREWVETALGGNSLLANFFAAVAGALMYFATLTEVPIVQGLMGAGMGKGPALALLLAGPAVSLPNILVVNSVMGIRKTMTFLALVVLMATISGFIYGSL